MIKESINYVKNWILAIKTVKKRQEKTELELAIEDANEMHRKTGKRYHVLPNSEGKLMVVDNRVIDRYNFIAKKKGRKKITIVELLQMALYSTK